MTNKEHSYPNAEDLIAFLRDLMLGMRGGSNATLRPEVFWNRNRVEEYIRAYFASMPQPVVFGTTIMVADPLERPTPEQAQRIGEDIWRNLGSIVLQHKDAIYNETKRDELTNEISVCSYLRILPWQEER